MTEELNEGTGLLERARDEGPPHAYAMDTLLIEAGRLNRIIRRLEETPPATPTAKLERTQVVTQLMRRVVEIFEAIDALGTAQGGEDDGE